jgi:hypothetical protein
VHKLQLAIMLKTTWSISMKFLLATIGMTIGLNISAQVNCKAFGVSYVNDNGQVTTTSSLSAANNYLNTACDSTKPFSIYESSPVDMGYTVHQNTKTVVCCSVK